MYVAGFALTFAAVLRPARRDWRMLGIRLRFIGLGLAFALPGAWLFVEGILDGSPAGIVAGLLGIGMGGLWLGVSIGRFGRWVAIGDANAAGPWDQRQHEPRSVKPPARKEP